MGTEFRRLAPETIIRVLYRLRAEIIREGQDGLEHVDALLRLRGADPEARRVPGKQPKNIGRGKLRMAILRALRDGSRPSREVVAAVAAERDWTVEVARKAVWPTLCRMRDSGVLSAFRRDGRSLLWGLAEAIEQTKSGDFQDDSHECLRAPPAGGIG